MVFINPLVVEVRSDRRRAVVSLLGELDLATVSRARSAFDELRAAGWPEVVADLRGLTFIDSQGLQLLVTLEYDARENGWSFAIVDDSQPVRRMLELTELTTFFEAAEDG
jgi:anti-anti-sigma factor